MLASMYIIHIQKTCLIPEGQFSFYSSPPINRHSHSKLSNQHIEHMQGADRQSRAIKPKKKHKKINKYWQ